MVDRVLTPLAMAVLDLLHEADMHPYEMHQTMLTRRSDRRVKLKAGSLYHTVDRLLADRLVEAVETTREGRRPERTVYRLTENGAAAFGARLREQLARVPVEYPEFPMVLSMLNSLSVQDAIEDLDRRVVALEAQLAADAVVIERLAERELPQLYWIDMRHEQTMRQAELAWLRTFLDDLGTGRIPWPVRDDDSSGAAVSPGPHDDRTKEQA